MYKKMKAATFFQVHYFFIVVICVSTGNTLESDGISQLKISLIASQ